jgi:hypothetical protein
MGFWPWDVNKRHRKIAFVVWGGLLGMFFLFAAALVYHAITDKDIFRKESPHYGKLPRVSAQSTVGMTEGVVKVLSKQPKGPPKLIATINATKGEWSNKRGGPGCGCNGTTEMIFDLSVVDTAALGVGIHRKIGIKFDFTMTKCSIDWKACKKRPEVKMMVVEPDCPPGECPLQLTSFMGNKNGWPNGVNYHLWKKFRGMSYLFHEEKEAHYRVTSATTGEQRSPDKLSFLLKGDTNTLPVYMEKNWSVKMKDAISALGGYISIMTVLFGFVFVLRYPKEHELVLRGHAAKKNDSDSEDGSDEEEAEFM